MNHYTKTQQKTYDLQYWAGGRLIETVAFNKPFGIIKHIEKTLKHTEPTTYGMGKFVIKNN